MQVKVKIWIEDNSQNLIFGSGKNEVLQSIENKGSIADASKDMGLNYKKAWNHIKILEKFIQDDLVEVNKGRGKNSGTKLTPKAKEIMQKYKTLEDDIKAYSKKRFEEIFKEDNKQIFSATLDNLDV